MIIWLIIHVHSIIWCFTQLMGLIVGAGHPAEICSGSSLWANRPYTVVIYIILGSLSALTWLKVAGHRMKQNENVWYSDIANKYLSIFGLGLYVFFNVILGSFCAREKFNWCSGAVCYTRSEKCYTNSKCIAIFNIKICYYIVLFIPISSKLEFFAMQNFESKLFPVHVSKLEHLFIFDVYCYLPAEHQAPWTSLLISPKVNEKESWVLLVQISISF